MVCFLRHFYHSPNFKKHGPEISTDIKLCSRICFTVIYCHQKAIKWISKWNVGCSTTFQRRWLSETVLIKTEAEDP